MYRSLRSVPRHVHRSVDRAKPLARSSVYDVLPGGTLVLAERTLEYSSEQPPAKRSRQEGPSSLDTATPSSASQSTPCCTAYEEAVPLEHDPLPPLTELNEDEDEEDDERETALPQSGAGRVPETSGAARKKVGRL